MTTSLLRPGWIVTRGYSPNFGESLLLLADPQSVDKLRARFEPHYLLTGGQPQADDLGTAPRRRSIV